MTTPVPPGPGPGSGSDPFTPGRGAVLGVGVDMVDLSEFAGQLTAPGTAFGGAFSAAERRQATERAVERGGAPGGTPGGGGLDRHLGVRWAAKEAVVKAWSAALYGSPPPIAAPELVWSEIETICDAWGRPAIRLGGAVEAAFVASVGGGCDWHVSLCHEQDTAIAFVVLSAGG